jgi:hypothetical protein
MPAAAASGIASRRRLSQSGREQVLRVGDLQDSDMVARRVAVLAEITCAAPAYIERFGMPSDVSALSNHRIVGFHSSATRELLPLEIHRRRRRAQRPSAGERDSERSRKSCLRRPAWCRADPGAAPSRRKRFGAGNARPRPPRLSAITDACLVALSPEPAAVTTRPRVHRLAHPHVRSKSRLTLPDPMVGCDYAVRAIPLLRGFRLGQGQNALELIDEPGLRQPPDSLELLDDLECVAQAADGIVADHGQFHEQQRDVVAP